MVSPRRLAAALLPAFLLVAAIQLGARQRVTKEDADRFQRKLEHIVQISNTPRSAAGSRQSTPITDAELNSYLRYQAKDEIPAGIVEPSINALGDGHVGGRAVVDLDAVRRQKQRGWLDPLGYVTGSMPLTATGTLTTKDGVGRFELESAEVGGITIPKGMVQELLSYYSRTRENPAGINMDDPFELPARIQEIRVGKGQSMVIQ